MDPVFGQLYWLTGNLLIDRDNRAKAHGTIGELVEQFNKKRISFWMFPEGTRSRGRGLLPFKTGAFHAAMAAGVPIIPIVVSNTHGKIDLNRLKNGLVIVEMLPPVDVKAFEASSVRKLATHCRELMSAKLEELNAEVEDREKTVKSDRRTHRRLSCRDAARQRGLFRCRERSTANTAIKTGLAF